MRASAATLLLSMLSAGNGVTPRNASSPVGPSTSQLSYTITVDPAHINQYHVELAVTRSPGRITLGMAKHPEYDDRFWRYVNGLTATMNGKPARIIREDSARWRVEAGETGTLVIRYGIHMAPPAPGIRPSWRSYVNANTALIGGAHSYIYPLERSTLPIRVHVAVPKEWTIATALSPAAGARDFTARVSSHSLTRRFSRARFTDGALQ